MANTITSATEANAITAQPLSSASAQLMNEGFNQNATTDRPISENMVNTTISQPGIEADVITTQPLINPANDEQDPNNKFSQFNPTANRLPENVEQKPEACWFCIPFTDCVDCTLDCGECWGDCSCDGCCENGCCEDGCCEDGCCEGGPSGDVLDTDGGNVGDCVECCGSCFECCSD